MEQSSNSVSVAIDWEQKYNEDIQKKEEELKSYRYRVLGVSELARQLEEKKEQVDVMKQKISRLEITLVRVENRASSLEKKLKSSGNIVAVADGNKTTHIPGPSKQILDTLLAENNKLKTTLNNFVKRGHHSGYVSAVKIDQLEGVIEQQREQIADLKEEINGLSSSDDDKSTVLLQRQLQKLNKSVKMKDEFCYILSLELKKVQNELQVANKTIKNLESGKDLVDGESKDSGISSEGNAIQETSPEAKEWQKKCEELQQQFDEQRQSFRSKEQRLIKLLSEKEELFSRESRVKNEAVENCKQLRQQIDQLRQSLSDSVNSANYDAVAKEKGHLVQQLEAQQREIEVLLADKARLQSEKKRIQESVDVGGGADQSNQLAQLQRELEAVRHEAESVRVERDELKEQNDEYVDNIAFLQDRLKQGEADKRTLEARIKNLDLNVRDLNGQLIRMGVRNNTSSPRGGFYYENVHLRQSMYMQAEVVKDGVPREQQQSSQSESFNPHCGPNIVDAVRRPVGVSRAPPSNPRVVQGHMNPNPHIPVRMDQQWLPHPTHFPVNHNQMFNPNPPVAGHMGNPSFMSLQQPQYHRGYRSYPGGDHPPPRSPDSN